MNSIPKEIAHVYAAVEKATRFSILPKTFSSPARQGVDDYVSACTELFRSSDEATVHAVEWFHDNPRFTQAHFALEEKLSRLLEIRSKNSGILPKGSSEEDLEILWSRKDLAGIFRCAVLLKFWVKPPALATLYAMCSGPYAVQGANQAYRSAIATARRAASRDEIALLFRADEVEIFAAPSRLASLFVQAYKECIH